MSGLRSVPDATAPRVPNRACAAGAHHASIRARTMAKAAEGPANALRQRAPLIADACERSEPSTAKDGGQQCRVDCTATTRVVFPVKVRDVSWGVAGRPDLAKLLTQGNRLTY